MKEAKFTVFGEPRGKGRPRFSMRKTKEGKSFITVRSPDDTVVYENLIRVEFERQCGGVYFQKDTPLAMEVTAYYKIPSSASRKKAALMVAGKLRPLKKVDSTNLLKAVEDALNSVAYHDDVQFVDTRITRYYGMVPRVEVVIRELYSEENE